MIKQIIQKLADSEDLCLNGDLDYFELQMALWLKSIEHMLDKGKIIDKLLKEDCCVGKTEDR